MHSRSSAFAHLLTYVTIIIAIDSLTQSQTSWVYYALFSSSLSPNQPSHTFRMWLDKLHALKPHHAFSSARRAMVVSSPS